MSMNPSEPAEQGQGAPSADDTAAFQRFYFAESPKSRSLLYRIFVGWWRDRT
jgi:hypothetical protein